MQAYEQTSKCCPVIVLGALRTGTSLVAEMVHRWGAYAGEPDQLTEADEHNQQGYWEYRPIWDFLVKLGDLDKGVSWWNPSFQDLIKARLSIPEYRSEAMKLTSAMECAGRLWVWKDPALSLYLPFWKRIWIDPVYIVTVRNPYDTAVSLQKFIRPAKSADSVSFIAGNLLRWQYMILLILEHIEESQKKIFISYESLLQAPSSEVRRLYDFLNQNSATNALNGGQMELMNGAINPKLWRNRNQISLSQVQEATVEQDALYQFLKAKVKDSFAEFDGTKYAMTPGWVEFVNNEEALIKAYSTSASNAEKQ